MVDRPVHLDLKKDEGLTVHWHDGSKSFYPVAYLRKMSPSADARQLREEMKSNPLTVLPSSAAGQEGPITALDAEMVGNYAIRIHFSDGHSTGIYSWSYLREIDPAREDETGREARRDEP
ncbi:MAG: DUF971 domain-containing protein [Planctomycetota bacterium]|nr:DUF971 domain-containing protein [Planctomycetota bacterium]